MVATSQRIRIVDPMEVERAFSVLFEQGQVVEVRALEASQQSNSRYTQTLGGYFDNVTDLLRHINTIQIAMGIYVTIQPCNEDLLDRAENKLISQKKDFSTSDKYITSYRWLLIDSDPERVSNISSTDEEHEQALAHSRYISEELKKIGWPDPLRADSGNGSHLLYRIDLSVGESDLVKRVLEGLAARFDTSTIHVDTGVYNPSRICKLYGTLACKGDNTRKRPHRMSRVIDAPETLQVVSRELLEAIAKPSETPKSEQTTKERTAYNKGCIGDVEWMQRFIDTYGIAVVSYDGNYNGGAKWLLPSCPFCHNSDHNVILSVRASGEKCFSCSHSSCKDKYKWEHFRVIYEPDAYTKKQYQDYRPGATSSSNGNGHQEAKKKLPEFIIEGQLRDQEDRAVAVLEQANEQDPQLFMYLGGVARIDYDENRRPCMRQLDRAAMRHELSHAADFYILKKKKGGNADEYEMVPAHPPKDLADQLLSLPSTKWGLKRVKALVEAPTIRPDGTILSKAGYDESTRLYYIPGPGMDKVRVPEFPTREDAIAAMDFLRPIFADFPFEGEADRANAFGLLLTPFTRYAVKKDIQMALIDGTNAGTGKGLVASVISNIATGASTTPLIAKKDEDEWRKAILTELLTSPRIVVIDNIRGVLESASLELMLTGNGINERILGQSKSAKPKNEATWIATGNNLLIGGDLARRCYRIRMVAQTANPDERPMESYTIPDLEQYTLDHRAEIVSAILTIARAWYVAGKPGMQIPLNLGTFTDWARTIGGMLEYAGMTGFQGNREALRSRNNEEAAEWENFLDTWLSTFDDEWKTSAEITEELTVKNTYGAIQPSARPLYNALPQNLKRSLAEKPNSFAVSLGIALQMRVQTLYGIKGLRVERDIEKHSKNKLWRVVRMVADGYSTPHTSENFKSNHSNTHMGDGETNHPQPSASTGNESVQHESETPQNGSTSGINSNGPVEQDCGGLTNFADGYLQPSAKNEALFEVISENQPSASESNPPQVENQPSANGEIAVPDVRIGQWVNTCYGIGQVQRKGLNSITVDVMGKLQTISGAGLLTITPRKAWVAA